MAEVTVYGINATMAKLRSMPDGGKRNIANVDAEMFSTLKYIRAHGLDLGAGFELCFSDDWKRIRKRNL